MNRPSQSILLLTAISVEIDATIRRIQQRRRRGLAGAMSHRDATIHWAITGMGGQRMRQTAAALIAELQPSHVVLVGMAGGLHVALEVGDVRQVAAVISLDGASRYELQTTPNASAATLLTVDELVTSVAGKQALRDRFHADMVDMETWHLADVCAQFGAPLTALRVVSDGAKDDLPPWLVKLTHADGTPNLRQALCHACLHLPTLLQLAASSRRTTQSLAAATEQVLATIANRLT